MSFIDFIESLELFRLISKDPGIILLALFVTSPGILLLSLIKYDEMKEEKRKHLEIKGN
ncbi:TPA: hypothetical protein ACGIK9_003347 [Acinetobacter baumannii]|uniref:hypothetical protein n=1 Tax=Acinetobacter baumannii TaxID=470 RepID=UPI00338D5916